MNANELADELERFESFNGDVFFGTCAVMLRQQQAEIAELKVMLGHYEDVYEGVVTHPVKELTDEEILEIASPMFEDARYPSTALDFARAILRKAQEK